MVSIGHPQKREEYYKYQAEKASRDAKKAADAGNPVEAARQADVAARASEAADSKRKMVEEAAKKY